MIEEAIITAEEAGEIESEQDIIPANAENQPCEEIEPAEQPTEAEESLDSLRQQISDLKEQISRLEKMRQTQTRVLEELADFRDMFPEVEISAVPDEVWESVKKGTPLIASYALYERRVAAERQRIARINASNASKSAGIAGKNTASEYFSPDEVRKMSRAEVHANYSKIKESMKKWM